MASLIQKEFVEIGPVNGHVTSSAFTLRCEAQAAVRNIRRQRIDVTLQTEEAPFAPQQELPVHRAMRRVTTCASLHFYGGVFKHKRSSFFRMAVDAAFPRRLSQHRLIIRAVCVVAVRAFHESFGNTVMRRQCKLRLNRRVARVTQLRLGLAQKALIQPPVLFGDSRRAREMSLSQWRFRLFFYVRSFHKVSRMTLQASHAMKLVLRLVKQRLVVARDVTR